MACDRIASEQYSNIIVTVFLRIRFVNIIIIIVLFHYLHSGVGVKIQYKITYIGKIAIVLSVDNVKM